MVWSYHDVKKLRKKRARGQEIEISEIRALEKYVQRKNEVAHLGGQWSEKQLLRAEELLRDIKNNKQELEVSH